MFTNVELGRRLRNENELRKQNSLLEHIPQLHSPDFEVFDDRSRGRGMGLKALRSFVEGQEIMREKNLIKGQPI